MYISLIAPSVATVNTLLTPRHNMQGLLAWFDVHARPLPWRIEKVSPWESLLAEIILQQTRMETGIPYWERIRTAYPNPAALAKDSEENLLHLWQGCGYYARARNLYKLAKNLDGKPLPKTYDELRKLPGIGPYTAAAIASICHHQPVACVDGNIRRVISRYRAEHMTDSQLQQEATELLDIHRPGDWNQAMMDLGSQICTPRNPSCDPLPHREEVLGLKGRRSNKMADAAFNQAEKNRGHSTGYRWRGRDSIGCPRRPVLGWAVGGAVCRGGGRYRTIAKRA